MGLELFMVGLITRDMGKSLAFYRRLGLAIPEGSEAKTHVEVKMESGVTFFLDSRPDRWDPGYGRQPAVETREAPEEYRSLLEFYMPNRATVDERYSELLSLGGHGRRAPYETVIGMYFALIDDPDGNTLLLSADQGERKSS